MYTLTDLSKNLNDPIESIIGIVKDNDIFEINMSYLFKLHELAKNDVKLCAEICAISVDLAEQFRELPLSRLSALASSRFMMFKPTFNAKTMMSLTKTSERIGRGDLYRAMIRDKMSTAS